MGAVVHARAGAVRVGRTARQQGAGEAAGGLALAGAGRPVQQVRVGGTAVVGERGAEHGGGVGVLVEHLRSDSRGC